MREAAGAPGPVGHDTGRRRIVRDGNDDGLRIGLVHSVSRGWGPVILFDRGGGVVSLRDRGGGISGVGVRLLGLLDDGRRLAGRLGSAVTASASDEQGAGHDAGEQQQT